MVKIIWIPDSETIISSSIFYIKICTFAVLAMPQPILFYTRVNLDNWEVAEILLVVLFS